MVFNGGMKVERRKVSAILALQPPKDVARIIKDVGEGDLP